MDLNGLTSAEVEAKRAAGESNKIDDRSANTYAAIFIRNLATPFNIILFILGAALLICNDVVSAISATGIITINIFISTVQEWKAKRRLDKIAVLMRPNATVLRDGSETSVDLSDIVRGDIIHLGTGEQAQVDGEVLISNSVEMDESLLTGESKTIRKKVGDTVFSGSSCVAGDCYFRADKVGEETFSAKMTAAARKFEKKGTPLQRETNAVTETLIIIAFAFIVIAFILNLIRGIYDVTGLLREAVVILDIVPIALFLLITINYMVSAVRMADSGVLLQNSASVESMSHVDTVCMDKTGTITTNRLLFDDVMYFGDEAEARRMIRELCAVSGSKNRTLGAVESHFGTEDCTLLDEILFSSGRKYSAVRVQNWAIDTVYMGAWNVLRQYCKDTEVVDGAVSALSMKGLRTVIFCTADGAELHAGDDEVDPVLRPLAAVSIRDEVRPDCREILNEFEDSGMDIKVISGDDPDTVDALFSLAGIKGERNVLSGDDLDRLSGEEYDSAVLKTNIFGRMRPEQKEDVIESLRRSGRYVAMVGDGVNDVRSIKKANVGVAMETGSSAARGVADMILLKDNFKALPRAITEGKKTVSGMRDILRLYITRNVILAILVFIMLIVFGTSPMLPIQNTAYAAITISLAALMLTFWAKPTDDKGMILPKLIHYGAPVSVCSVAGGLIVYLLVYYATLGGYIDADAVLDYMVSVAQNINISGLENWAEPYTTHEGMLDHMTEGGALSLPLVFGRNAMLVFLILAGLLHLLLLFPPVKALSWDGTYGRSVLPLVLMVLLFLLVICLYEFVPWFVCIFASMVLFPPWVWILLIAATAVYYVVTLTILRSKLLARADPALERLSEWVTADKDILAAKKLKNIVPHSRRKSEGGEK